MKIAKSAYFSLTCLLLGAVSASYPQVGAWAANPASLSQSTTPTFAAPGFRNTWERTDSLVAAGSVKRTWFWGPAPRSGGLTEDYLQGSGGKRLVQYFDKSRMEINNPDADPNSPWYVTNGLLTVEMVSGKMQTGDNSFSRRAPANIAVTGDAGDPSAPTYASFTGVSNAAVDHRDTDRTGLGVTATLDRTGRVGQDPSKAGIPGARIAYYERSTGHNVPAAIWTFLNMSGSVEAGGRVVAERLNNPWFYASGLPISEPYWATALIAGKATSVLVQAYERRVLTYVPTNPDGFQVEMGNVGQHYYDWRYGGADAPPVTASSTPEPPQPAPPTLSRYAIDPNGDLNPAVLDQVGQAGTGVVRVEVRWIDMEPAKTTPAQYNWAGVDARLKKLSDRGLVPLVLLTGCPTWACSRVDGPIRVEHVGEFVEFMSALAARYGGAPYNAHMWEFWNEPDAFTNTEIKYGWGAYPERYAAMLKAVRPAMLAADPYAKVVMGGLAYDAFTDQGGPFNRGFVDAFLNAGGGQAIDYFNFHYYVQNANWCSFAAKLAELKTKLSAHNANVPIICTETGFTSNPQYGSGADTQSAYLAQVYAEALGEGASMVTWYTSKDFATNVAGWQIFKDSGIIDLNGNPKPSYAAYRFTTSEIGKRPVSRRLGPNDGVIGGWHGYEFGADEAHPGALWTVWAWDFSTYGTCGSAPAPRDFTIPMNMAAKVARVSNMYGQPVATRTGSNGSLVFPLDMRPVYIEWR